MSKLPMLRNQSFSLDPFFSTRFESIFDEMFSGLERKQSWLPAIDVTESDKEMVVKMDAPGIKKDDRRIELNGSYLTVSGQRSSSEEKESEGYHRIERAYGTFSRTITLPDQLDPEDIRASYNDGVLEIRLPRVLETEKNLEIPISSGKDSEKESDSEDKAKDKVEVHSEKK